MPETTAVRLARIEEKVDLLHGLFTADHAALRGDVDDLKLWRAHLRGVFVRSSVTLGAGGLLAGVVTAYRLILRLAS